MNFLAIFKYFFFLQERAKPDMTCFISLWHCRKNQSFMWQHVLDVVYNSNYRNELVELNFFVQGKASISCVVCGVKFHFLH